MLYMSWGQFLDHDLVGTPMTKGMHCSNFLEMHGNAGK